MLKLPDDLPKLPKPYFWEDGIDGDINLRNKINETETALIGWITNITNITNIRYSKGFIAYYWPKNERHTTNVKTIKEGMNWLAAMALLDIE